MVGLCCCCAKKRERFSDGSEELLMDHARDGAKDKGDASKKKKTKDKAKLSDSDDDDSMSTVGVTALYVPLMS
eukprot:CAMPEP_0172544026 /NCGR_PEP_ID=MMETSP1067-20121228/14274_1 /TAXON_ID=265564 ORGANISM="Thalassiosira punctigera, Strain Tpunct2005C2" /NCGR_SAMPLE_ID=MMETSP1067 /ASSEMBLY_ACC=CAM_ASM_000444 /LENGTH=72 /DNA_ID=CAMNT_0013330521 /DNA_START=158 /DNA_END=376 /DNA_ORIENTATION=+